jgi:Putative Flp pilus-assembly TadE/G-like/von Willebrand factor type A domain
MAVVASTPLRPRGNESGQVIVLFAVALVVLLGMAALAIDVGYAYYAKRSLQASADAAALAGAASLPDGSVASSTAYQYGGADGGKNENANVPPVTTKVTTRCVSVAPCNPVNAILVEQSTVVPTRFAKLLGIDQFNISVKATACSPCGAKPLDIMLVLDRTGSMCQDSNGNTQPSCPDLVNAKQGVRDFIAFMDPTIDRIGLAVFPPAASQSARCNTPDQDDYDSTSAPYVIAPLASDFKIGNNLNTSSRLVSTLNCLKGNGSTAYATAIEKAQAELDLRGRSTADDIIVFFSDGAANTGPTYYPSNSPYRRQPCRQGVTSAGTAKGKKTTIYSIGYDLDALGGGANVCRNGVTNALESPSITAYQAIQGIASGPDKFFNQPSAGELQTLYTRVASEITGARLIDDGLL